MDRRDKSAARIAAVCPAEDRRDKSAARIAAVCPAEDRRNKSAARIAAVCPAEADADMERISSRMGEAKRVPRKPRTVARAATRSSRDD